jgi:hypothetical protein
MAARYEIAVNRVSDDSGVTVSNTVGSLSFPEDDPLNVTAINPLDYRSLLVLKKFCEGQLKEAEKLAKG